MDWFPELFLEKLPAWFMNVMCPMIVIIFLWLAVMMETCIVMCYIAHKRCPAADDFYDLPDKMRWVMAIVIAFVFVTDTILAIAVAWLQAGWMAAIVMAACLAAILWIGYRLID